MDGDSQKTISRILGCVRRADTTYGLFDEGDRVLVGISGGKDSLTMLDALSRYRRFSKASFELRAVMIDMGFEKTDEYKEKEKDIVSFCDRAGVPFEILPSKISEVVFGEHEGKKACGLCARMRHRALLEYAKDTGCGKIALGHHREDAVDTFFMNLIYEARLGSTAAKRRLEGTETEIIRPLILTPEKEIVRYAKEAQLPVLDSLCPMDRHTEREEIRRFLSNLDKSHRGVYHRVFKAMRGEAGSPDDILTKL